MRPHQVVNLCNLGDCSNSSEIIAIAVENRIPSPESGILLITLPGRHREGYNSLLIFIFDKSQTFINGSQGQIKILLGVAIRNIGVVVRREKETFPD